MFEIISQDSRGKARMKRASVCIQRLVGTVSLNKPSQCPLPSVLDTCTCSSYVGILLIHATSFEVKEIQNNLFLKLGGIFHDKDGLGGGCGYIREVFLRQRPRIANQQGINFTA